MYIYLFLFSQLCLQKTNQLGNANKKCILTAIKKVGCRKKNSFKKSRNGQTKKKLGKQMEGNKAVKKRKQRLKNQRLYFLLNIFCCVLLRNFFISLTERTHCCLFASKFIQLTRTQTNFLMFH